MACIESNIVEEAVRIPGEDYCLEGFLRYAESCEYTGVVLLVPPHPNFAGTMENNVIQVLARRLVDFGYITLRFNYPGIGGSRFPGMTESSFDFWDRIDKDQRFSLPLESARLAWDYVLNIPSACKGKRFVIGYSFGALIALLLAQDIEQRGETLDGVVAVAMPWIERYDYDVMQSIPFRKLFLSGKDDFVFHKAIFDKQYGRLSEPKAFLQTNDDHFFRGRETNLMSHIVDYFYREVIIQENVL